MKPSSLSTIELDNGEEALGLSHGLLSTEHQNASVSGSSTSKYEAKIETHTETANGLRSDEAYSEDVEVNLSVQNVMDNSDSCHANGNCVPRVWRVKVSSESCPVDRKGALDIWAPEASPKSCNVNGDFSHDAGKESNTSISPSCPVNVNGCLLAWKPKQNLVSTSSVMELNDKESVIVNENLEEVKPLKPDRKEKSPSCPVNVDDCLKVWKPKKNLVSISPVLDLNDKDFVIANGKSEDIISLKLDRKELPPCQNSVQPPSTGLSGEFLSIEQERNSTSVSITLDGEVKRRTNSEYLNGGCSDESCHSNMDRIIKPLKAERNPELCNTNRDGSLKVWKVCRNSESGGLSCKDVNSGIWKLNRDGECSRESQGDSTQVWERHMNYKSSLANVDGNHKVWKPKDLHFSTDPLLMVMGSKSSTFSEHFEGVKPRKSETSASLPYQCSAEQDSVKSADEGFSTKMEKNYTGRVNVSKAEKKSKDVSHKLSKCDVTDRSSFLKDVNLPVWTKRNSELCRAVEISRKWMPKNNDVSTSSIFSLDCNELDVPDRNCQGVNPLKSATCAVLQWHSAQQSSNLLVEELSTKKIGNFASGTNMLNAEVMSETYSESSNNNSSEESSFVDRGGNLKVWRVKRNPESSIKILDEVLSAKQVGKFVSSTSMSDAEGKSETYSESSNNDSSCFANRGENLEVWRLKRNAGFSLNLSDEELSTKQVNKSVNRAITPNAEVKSETCSESSNSYSSDEFCFANSSKNLEVGRVRRNLKSCRAAGDVILEVLKSKENCQSYRSSVHGNLKVWKQKKNPVSDVSVQRVCSESIISNGSDYGPLLLSKNNTFVSHHNSAKQSSVAFSEVQSDKGETTFSGRTHSLKGQVKCEKYSTLLGGGGSNESSNANGGEKLPVGNMNRNDGEPWRASKNLKTCPVNMNGNSNVWKPKKSPVSKIFPSNAASNAWLSNGTIEAVETSNSEMNASLPCQGPSTQSSAETEASNHKKLEDFLFDMLGHGFQLDRTVIRQVLGNCGYDMKQSLNKLLDLAAETLLPKRRLNQGKETIAGWNQTQKINHCNGTKFANYNGLKDLGGRRGRYEQVHEVSTTLLGVTEGTKASKEDFIVGDSTRYDTSSYFVAESDYDDIDVEHYISSTSIAEDDEEVDDEIYCTHREAVAEYRSLMKEYYQAAAEAFAKDDIAQALTLLEKAQFFYRKGREADEESAKRTFQMSETDEDNQKGMTLDLQFLKVKEAIRAVKCHLRALCGVGILRITNGAEEDSSRESRKRKVTMFLDKESIKWREEDGDPLTILVRLDEINPNHLSFGSSSNQN